MKDIEVNALDWKKMEGLIPAVIQHAENGNVLMLGYMNTEALIATATSGQLTLFSRSRNRLWRKGDDSGNSMAVQHISTDCDNDSLLIQVLPNGPACHKGNATCYQTEQPPLIGFLAELMDLINHRLNENSDQSYTANLANSGVNRCAQKVGEEAVEAVIAATSGNQEELIQESADLIFHLMVLLKICDLSFYQVIQCLQSRDLETHT